MLGLLLLLVGSVSIFNISLLPFHFTVIKDLEASEVLLLKGPESFFLFFGIPCGLRFSQLLAPFMKDGVLLLLVKALKVVWLDSVVGEHRLLGGGVLRHKVVTGCVVDIVLSLHHLVHSVCVIAILLFLGRLFVGICAGFDHVCSLFIVILLSICKILMELGILRGYDSVSLLSRLFVKLFLTDLLFAPVSLL